MKSRRLFTLIALAAIFVITGPLQASDPGDWNFELYGGWYLSGDLQAVDEIPGGIFDALEELGLEPGDDLTFGLRTGRRVSDSWGWQVTAGIFDFDDAAERTENKETLSLNIILVDASFVYYLGGGNLLLYGGPGFATANLELSGEILGEVDESNTNLSVHAGISYNLGIGESAYLRFDGRLRYIDADFYGGDLDGEMTLALGWNF